VCCESLEATGNWTLTSNIRVNDVSRHGQMTADQRVNTPVVAGCIAGLDQLTDG
jgi:hypothetical protein